MIRWLLCLTLGVAVAWLAYGHASASQRSRMLLLGTVRALAVALVAALLIGAPAGRARRIQPLVALDASASWRRAAGADSLRWQEVLRTASASAASDTVLLFGDSLREVTRASALALTPSDNASLLRPVVDRASALGRAIVLITDGETDDGPSADELPTGSRIVVPPSTARIDAAMASIEAPGAATAGDTMKLAVLVVAGGSGAPAGEIRLLLDGRQLAAVANAALSPFASRRTTLSLPLPRGARTSIVQAAIITAGDAEPRNDTVSVAVEIGDRPPVVFVSTSPDLDVREALTVLRGALDVPAKAYLRLAPGVWREEGTLAAITEEEVLARAKGAGLIILHGDTTWGGVAGMAKGARALWTPAPPLPPARAGEMQRAPDWYATAAPPSPLAGALAGLPWDTLPPLNVATPARGEFTVLEARIGRAGTPVPIVAGRERAGTRTLSITGSGFSGWALRGGRSADAFTALWGAIFDWLAAARSDARSARPTLSAVRAGDPIAWRRGGSDSVVTAIITKRATSATLHADTLQLRFSADGAASSPSLTPGLYDVRVAGGSAVLVVNASREWIPRAATVTATSATFGSVPADVPLLAELGWPFVLALLLLSGEWLGRRWAGLR